MQALQKAKDAFHEEQKAAAPYLARAHRSILDATVEDLASSPLNDDGGAVAYDASNGEQNSRQSAAATAPRTATCCGCFSPPGMSAVPDEEGGGTQQNTQTGRRSLAGIYAALPVLWSTWIFLIILGLAVGVAGFSLDIIIKRLQLARLGWLGEGYSFFGYFVWISWALILGAFALATGHLITPLAEGSGIPQMKSVLAGTAINRFLSLRVLVAKVIGFTTAIAGGLSVGREGPFVHVACAMATLLWKIPCFSRIRESQVLRKQMLAASVAAGVTAVFGAPIGGVLFSVEVTSTYYMASNLWRAFVASVVGVLFYEAISSIQNETLFKRTEFETQSLSWQIILYAAMGIILGLLAALFINVLGRIQVFRRAVTRNPKARYGVGLPVIFLVTTITYSLITLRMSDKQVINSLFEGVERTAESDESSARSLINLTKNEIGFEVWTSPNRIFNLIFFSFFKFVLTVVSISLPIPCGLFTPVFTIGAAIGRLMGETMTAIFGSQVIPGTYAVMGAAGLVAGVTQTISPAVIVFELTRQIHHMVPALVVVLLAYSTSSLFTVSVYDMLMAVNGLPYLPRALSMAAYRLHARDLMHSVKESPHFLTLQSTMSDVNTLLEMEPFSGGTGQLLGDFPIVDSAEKRILVGTVKRTTLVRVLQSFQEHVKSTEENEEEHTGLAKTLDSSSYQYYDTVISSSIGRSRSKNNSTRPSVSAVYNSVASATSESGRTRQSDDSTSSQQGLLGNEEKQDPAEGLPITNLYEQLSFSGLHAELLRSLSMSMNADGRIYYWDDNDEDDSDNDDAHIKVPECQKPWTIRVNPAPFSVAELTPLSKIHFLFAIATFAQIFVIREGKLVGTILKEDLTNEERLVAKANSQDTV